jgi:hypothetical protein
VFEEAQCTTFKNISSSSEETIVYI